MRRGIGRFTIRLLSVAIGGVIAGVAHGQSDLDKQLKAIHDFSTVVQAEAEVMGAHAGALVKLYEENPRGSIDKKKFEAVFRSSKAVRGATSVGVTLPRLRELTQGLATEVDILRGQTSNSAELRLLNIYEQVLRVYASSATIWAAKIEYGQPDDDLLRKATEVIQLGWSLADNAIGTADKLYLAPPTKGSRPKTTPSTKRPAKPG